MTTIWKYILHPANPTITTPQGAILRHAATQGDDICIWAEVDPTKPVDEIHHIEVFGTGRAMPPRPRVYVGTAFLPGLVFHVYESNANGQTPPQSTPQNHE